MPSAPRISRRDRATRIAAQLQTLFPHPPIPLHHEGHFQLLVAVMLSAQTTDARVNLVTPALFERGPDAARMAALSEAEILSLIASCNLAPTKARNVRRTAELLLERHGGEVPHGFEALEALPGVGHKTASVVMSQAFGEPAFPVDTHIHRLAARWGLSSGKTVEQTEADLKAVFPRETWNDLHLQIIYFGRSYCPARGHVVAACPICSWAMSATRLSAERRAGQSR